jgi:hypothetical protein
MGETRVNSYTQTSDPPAHHGTIGPTTPSFCDAGILLSHGDASANGERESPWPNRHDPHSASLSIAIAAGWA